MVVVQMVAGMAGRLAVEIMMWETVVGRMVAERAGEMVVVAEEIPCSRLRSPHSGGPPACEVTAVAMTEEMVVVQMVVGQMVTERASSRGRSSR